MSDRITIHPGLLSKAAETLGMTHEEFFSAAKIGQTLFYRMNGGKSFMADGLAKVNAFLKAKGVAPLVPPDATSDVPAEDPPLNKPRGRNVEMVPSGFLPHALDTLGITNQELARLAGVSIASIDNYKRRGFCPLSFRATVNGLLAEHAAGGTKQLGSVPEKAAKRRYVNGRFTLLVEEADMSAAVSLLATHGIRVTVTKE